jgi:hypothetical protein
MALGREIYNAGMFNGVCWFWNREELTLPSAPPIHDNTGFQQVPLRPNLDDWWSETCLKYPIECELRHVCSISKTTASARENVSAECARVILSCGHNLTINRETGEMFAVGKHEFWIKRDRNDPSGGFVRLRLQFDLCDTSDGVVRSDLWFTLNHEFHPRWRLITNQSKFVARHDEGLILTIGSAGGAVADGRTSFGWIARSTAA